MLTPRTKDITIEHMNKAYQYIDEVIKERGYAPSVMDITKYLGYASKSSTHRILRMMEDEGSKFLLAYHTAGRLSRKAATIFVTFFVAF